MARVDNPAIDNPTTVASGFSRKIFWVGAPLAAAAIVVLALLLPLEQVEQKPAPPVVANSVQPPSLPLTEAPFEARSGKPEARSQQPEAGRRQPRNARADRIIAAAALEPAPAEMTPRIEPLKAIDPIRIAPLTQEAIAPAQIEFRPLTAITEVQIAPLSLPERRH
jgi:hypothetical protein